ncbi:Basal cell adhesion molecule [Fukomys damarensis]|uniref:Basal cell adhesion molecule n=1 Tax=Fukomys damarensis TaxID=885580 RepID=A0A091EE16_FUKDA|nr:Basal cell adhesion molecule [Fukomys damarensis]
MHVSVPPLVEVMRGEQVTLNCTPSSKPDHFVLEWFLVATCSSRNGNPAPQISWYRNGRLLELPTEMNEDGYMTLRTVREASGLLSLSSTLYLRVRKADRSASFHCVAQYRLPGDRHGRLDSPAFNLTLHYPTEHVHLWVGSPSTTEGWVREGDSVQLLCQGDGSPNPEYTFFRLQDRQEEVLSTNLEGKLTLEGVNRSQSGTYGCRVEDFDAAEDVVLTRTLGVNVSYLDPLELSVGKELSVFLNSSRVAVTCSARAQPAPSLRWTKDSVPLEDGPTLSLGSFTFDSAGTYVCEASVPSVPLLSRTQSFRLLVQGSPELRAKELEPRAEGSWTEGEDVELTCAARGYPEPELTWSQPGGSAGVAVMAVAVSVGLLLLVVAAFYCMRRKGRPGCCHRREKGTPPPGEPELSHSGSERPEQTDLLMGGSGARAQGGSGAFRDEVGEGQALGTGGRQC